MAVTASAEFSALITKQTKPELSEGIGTDQTHETLAALKAAALPSVRALSDV